MLIFQFDSDITLELFEYYLIPWSTKKSYCYNLIILCEKLIYYFKQALLVFQDFWLQARYFTSEDVKMYESN